jgi:hypothetical protein
MAGGIKVHVFGDYDDKDIKKAIKDLQSLQGQAGPTQKASSGIAAGFKSIALAAGAFIGLSAVKNFMGDAIQQGSALEESLSKVNVVFGDSADAIIAWSEDSATAFGQSQAQALESVGTFGNLLQAFGSTQDEAQVMSQRMVELAADLASFNNTSVDDALTALRSGLSGETEPLKRFGVAINDARLKTVALEKGLYSGKGTLDVYAKSVAAYELILKDTTLAQGDFARTSDGFANQMRILEAGFTDMKAALGTGLLAGFSTANGAASDFSETMKNLEPILIVVGERLGESAAGAARLAGRLGGLVDSTGEAEGGFQSFIDKLTTSPLVILADALDSLDEATGHTARAQRDAANAAWSAADAYTANTTEALRNSSAVMEQEQAVRDAEAAMKALKDEVNNFKAAIAGRQEMDDFRKMLRDLDKDLEGNTRTLTGMSDAAYENKKAMRDAFTDAADAVQGMVDRGEIDADRFEAKYAKLGSKVVDQFVKDGFSRADVRKFLKAEGLWLPEFNRIGNYASAAGVTIGKDLIDGMAGAINSPANLATLRYAGMQAAAAAEQGARIESETQSPSKKWAKLGGDLVSGLIVGLGSKKDALKAEAGKVARHARRLVGGGLVGHAGRPPRRWWTRVGHRVWGQFLMDEGLVKYMIDNLSTVTDTATDTANAMTPSFLLSAQESAKALYDAFVADYGKDAPLRKKLEALMDRLSKSLNRTSTITIRTVYESAGINFENPGFRAKGGPVYSGKPYIVGEKGPEMFVPQMNGTIVPNNELPMASGGVRGGDGASMSAPTYTINVQAGVGDPRQIGQQVVEYIKRFESSNGAVFAAA